MLKIRGFNIDKLLEKHRKVRKMVNETYEQLLVEGKVKEATVYRELAKMDAIEDLLFYAKKTCTSKMIELNFSESDSHKTTLLD